MSKIKKFLFNNISTRQTVVKNTLWIGVSTTIIKIVRAFIIMYAARLLGTESYGIFTYAMSIAALFAVFSDMGISSILVRELSKNEDKIKEYFSTAFIIKLGFLITTVLLILSVGPFVSKFEASTTLIPIVALSIFFDSLRTFLYSIPRSKNKMETEAGIGLLNEVFCVLLIIVLFLREPTAQTLVYSFTIGNGLGLLIALFTTRRYLIAVPQFFTKTLVLPLIKLIAPFAILSIFGIFMTNIDSVMIGWLTNEHLVGLYGAAQKPISIIYILPNFLASGLLPVISTFLKNKQPIKHIVTTASTASLVVALPLVVGGIITAPAIIFTVFGSSYSEAIPVFRLLLITALFLFPATIYAEVLLAENKQKIFIFTGIIGALLNVGLNLILIPKFGIAGSALSTIVAQAVLMFIFYIEMRKTQKVPIITKPHKTIFAVLIMGIITASMVRASIPLIIVITVACCVYVALLFVQKEKTVIELKKSLKIEA